MNIGDKIKTLRTELHITQKELAGEEITRNMLSRIENGFALPSVDTLLYIAKRLGVPAGFLIADESEDFIYRKSAEIAKIRESYRRADWKGCERLCELISSRDSECERYITGCRYNLARDSFSYGELKQASKRFNEVKERCIEGFNAMYPDGVLNQMIASECDIYLMCLSDISPIFSGEEKKPVLKSTDKLHDPFAIYYTYYRPEGGRAGGARPTDVEAEIYANGEEDEKDSFYRGHIRARLLMKKGDFKAACKILKDIAYGESLIPQPVLLFLLSDLENCFKELSDFKSAYECSGLHRELLESFIGDKN